MLSQRRSTHPPPPPTPPPPRPCRPARATKCGWGYCFCTDGHGRLREALGRPIQSDTYIQFLIFDITGINLPPLLVDTATVAVFAVCLVPSIAMNIKDLMAWRGTRGRNPQTSPAIIFSP